MTLSYRNTWLLTLRSQPGVYKRSTDYKEDKLDQEIPKRSLCMKQFEIEISPYPNPTPLTPSVEPLF